MYPLPFPVAFLVILCVAGGLTCILSQMEWEGILLLLLAVVTTHFYPDYRRY